MGEPAWSCRDATQSDASGILEREPVSSRVLRGTYQLLGRLDAGAMGTVFEAEHLRLHRRVAVKVLSPELASRPDLLDRFRQEAEIVSQLEHPHVVTVLDFDVTEQGEPYLVLELLHGETLERRIDRDAPLALEDVVSITTQIASALSAAHRASIVHRDLKPSNVFLTGATGEPAFVKLLDFGISKNLRANRHITQGRLLVGTPEYMAPEQASARNDLIDARTDQYALAVVAYEMLTGIQPFDHQDLKVVLNRVSTLEVAPASSVAPWIPPELDAVLARALQKDQSRRYADILDFGREFQAAASAEARARSSVLPSAPRSGVRSSRGTFDTVSACSPSQRTSQRPSRSTRHCSSSPVAPFHSSDAATCRTANRT